MQRDGTTELVTPSLGDGTILPGVTRDSILQLARGWGEFEVSERKPSIWEVKEVCVCVFVCVYVYVCVDQGPLDRLAAFACMLWGTGAEPLLQAGVGWGGWTCRCTRANVPSPNVRLVPCRWPDRQVR